MFSRSLTPGELAGLLREMADNLETGTVMVGILFESEVIKTCCGTIDGPDPNTYRRTITITSEDSKC